MGGVRHLACYLAVSSCCGCDDNCCLILSGCSRLSSCAADSWRCPSHHFFYWEKSLDRTPGGMGTLTVLGHSLAFEVKATIPVFLGHVRPWAVSTLPSGHHLVLVPQATHITHVPTVCPPATPGQAQLCPPGQTDGEQGCTFKQPSTSPPFSPLGWWVQKSLLPSPSCSVTLKITVSCPHWGHEGCNLTQVVFCSMRAEGLSTGEPGTPVLLPFCLLLAG